MGSVLAAALMCALLFAPVRVTVQGRVGHASRWQVRASVWGVPLPALDSERLARKRRRAPPRADRARTALALLRRLVRARGHWGRHVRLEHLDIRGHIAAQRADSACLLSGALSDAALLLPEDLRRKTRLLVLPDFTGEASYCQFRGILTLRLGTLCAGAAMLGIHAAQEKRKLRAVKEAAV